MFNCRITTDPNFFIMDYIKHEHSVSVPRGGKVITGDNDYNGENVVIDTPEYDRLTMTPKYESTSKIGVIQPCLNLHVNAGDSFKIDANMFQRFQPLVATPLTAIETTLHTFYCPLRLLDYGFEQFFTGGHDGDYKIPLLNARLYTPVLSKDAVSTKDFSTATSLWSHHDEQSAKIARTPTFNGKPLGGIGSLVEDFGYGFEAYAYSGANNEVPIGTRAPRSFMNLFPLIAYQRIYNDFYRVPELEPDLFIHNVKQSLAKYAQSLRSHDFGEAVFVKAPLNNDQFLHVVNIDRLVYEWLQSEHAEGFFGYMLHLLTDPLLHQQLVEYAAVSSVGTFEGEGMNVIDTVSTHSAFVNPAWGRIDVSKALVFQCGEQFASSANAEPTDRLLAIGYYEVYSDDPENPESQSVEVPMSDLDLCIFVFLVALSVCKNAPYERDRFTSTLPYLQRGEYVKLVKKDLVTGSPTIGNKTVSVIKDSVFENGLIQTYASLSVGTGQYLASNISVDDLRQLNATAKFLEKNARVGYRFEEYIRGLFGIEVKGDDHLSKPSYIGGLKQYVNLDIVTSPVATEQTLQAQQAANMTMNGAGDIGDFSVPEPGIMLGFLISKPRTTYINAVDRNNFKYGDRTLFFTPDFAHLPEQPLWSLEINAQYGALGVGNLGNLINGDSVNPNISNLAKVFGGYEPRYNEYRNVLDHIGGELCSTQIYNTTARQDIDYAAPDDTFHNDYYWQHVMYNDPSVTRIFNYADDVTDQFMFALSWTLSRVSEVPNYANPKL